MSTFLSLIGIAMGFLLLKYREHVGGMIGEAEWMRKLGGVYNVVILVAVLLFFWSIAELTGTTSIFFMPLTYLIPGLRQSPPPATGF